MHSINKLYIDMGTTNIRVYQITDTTKGLIYSGSEGLKFFSPSNLFDKQIFSQFLVKQLSVTSGDIYCSGMIGSKEGIIDAGYLSIEQFNNPSNLNLKKVVVDNFNLLIFPGVCTNVEIMRGEEIELKGFLTNTQVDGDYTVLFPGTHTKVCKMDGSKLIDFHTVLTGEFLELITKKSSFTKILETASFNDIDEMTFLKGVKDAKSMNILNLIFKGRSNVILQNWTSKEALSYILGLTYASELATVDLSKPVMICCSKERQKLYELISDEFEFVNDSLAFEGFRSVIL